MTLQFENMLYLFGANANRSEIHLGEQINIEQIRKYSLQQGIWTLVFPELSKICDVNKYQPEFLSMITKAVQNRMFTLEIIRKLEAEGIKCCILKGATISPLYADPECRISGDTDILIDESDEKKTTELLLKYGYSVTERPANHHHMTATHKIGGILEVHVRLYSEMTRKIVFNNSEMRSDPWCKVKIDGNSYFTLSTQDTLMYLTGHYIKHLINSGGGVRQMMDLLLFIEKNKDKIDFEKYEQVLKSLKYDKLIEVIKAIGGKYFGFDYEVKYESLMEKILTDTEIGGIFGYSTKNRSGFIDEFCKKRTTMSRTKSKLYMAIRREGGYDWFPNQHSLINKYKYNYAKHKILIPIAWIHRYFDVILGTRKPEIMAKDTESFKDRMNMMRDLGMIE